MAWKPCSFCRGIGIHFAVEFVFFLPWNLCSLWRGIFNIDSDARKSRFGSPGVAIRTTSREKPTLALFRGCNAIFFGEVKGVENAGS
jgi:hypothetical protein